MRVPVPFGQYVSADTPVHRLDARAKLGVAVAYTVALFAIDSWWGLAIIALLALGATRLARTRVGLVLRGLRPVAWLLAFTIVINALFPARRTDALFTLGALWLDASGLRTGLFFAARIVLLVMGTSLVTLTTSPVALTDALASVMRPLGRLRFPVDDAAMMMSIALRFIPTTAQEAEAIIVAQTARGARFGRGGPIARARAWLPVLVPLFVRLFRRADDLATAMESRCYRGEGRTRLNAARFSMADAMVLFVGVSVVAAVAVFL